MRLVISGEIVQNHELKILAQSLPNLSLCYVTFLQSEIDIFLSIFLRFGLIDFVQLVLEFVLKS